MADSQEARREGVEDSQVTRLPDNYNRDPNATQRMQFSLLPSRSNTSTYGYIPDNIQLSRSHDAFDRDSRSQLSTGSLRAGESQFGTVPETPREFIQVPTRNAQQYSDHHEFAQSPAWNCYNVNDELQEQSLPNPIRNRAPSVIDGRNTLTQDVPMDEQTGTGIRRGSDSSDRSSSGTSISDGFDRVIYGREPLSHITNTVGRSSQASNNVTQTTECVGAIIPEWDGCSPDLIIKAMKALDKEELQCLGQREFYKCYGSWEKLSLDQRNKTISYFRSLSEDIQGTCFLVAFMCLVV
jgi:hypothetical protein